MHVHTLFSYVFSFFYFLSVSFWFYGFCTFLTLTNNAVCQVTCDSYMIARSINEAAQQTQNVSTAAHFQHWLCSTKHKQNRHTSPFPEHSTAMQKFCQYWCSTHATVWTRFNFHAVFWIQYYTSDGTLIARNWPQQMYVSTGCCCTNFTFWVTWTLASTYFLNAYPLCIADGAKEIHTSLQLAYIILKSDKGTLHF